MSDRGTLFQFTTAKGSQHLILVLHIELLPALRGRLSHQIFAKQSNYICKFAPLFTWDHKGSRGSMATAMVAHPTPI
jgi:hypothetical protein